MQKRGFRQIAPEELFLLRQLPPRLVFCYGATGVANAGAIFSFRGCGLIREGTPHHVRDSHGPTITENLVLAGPQWVRCLREPNWRLTQQ
jgi:hypothetical protein